MYRDGKSSGHCTPSSGASFAGSEARQCMVALHDYDLFHCGDIMTAYGDMDVNGFYRVDMNGECILFPSVINSLFLLIKLTQSEECTS